jgi:hypothetical protein
MKHLLLTVALLFGLVGCQKTAGVSTPAGVSDATLTKIASAVDSVAKSNKALTDFVIAQNAAGTIPDADTANILTVANKVAGAVKAATATTRAFTQMTPDQRGNVLSVIQAVIGPVNDALTNGLAGIKNQATLAKVTQIMQGIQAALGTAQAILTAASARFNESARPAALTIMGSLPGSKYGGSSRTTHDHMPLAA